MIWGQISLLFVSIIDFLLEILFMCLTHNNNIARLHNVFAPSLFHFKNDLISVSFAQCKLTQVYLDACTYKQMHEVNHQHKNKYFWLTPIGQMFFSTFALSYSANQHVFSIITVSWIACELLALERIWISESKDLQIGSWSSLVTWEWACCKTLNNFIQHLELHVLLVHV